MAQDGQENVQLSVANANPRANADVSTCPAASAHGEHGARFKPHFLFYGEVCVIK